MKQNDWEDHLAILFESITAIEVPEDVSKVGEFKDYLMEFCVGRGESFDIDELDMEKPYTDPKESKTYLMKQETGMLAKAKPKKEQATNAQLRKYYDDIEKIRAGAVTGETVTFDKKTYGGATGPAWQEFSKAWEKKYKKPEDPIKSFFKGVKKKITGEKKRGGGQVSRRPVKYSTMKKMYSHGGPVRKPKRI